MTLSGKLSSYLSRHPVFMVALGLGSLLAGSTTLLSAVMLGSGFMLVLMFSSVTLAVIRNLVPHQFRLVFILMITSVWVSVLDMLLQAHLYQVRVMVDIYVPLLAMNSLVLLILEQEVLIHTPARMLRKSMIMAALPVLLCLLTGLLRELLVTGTVRINIISIDHAAKTAVSLPLFDTVAGAFIIAGCLLALLAQPELVTSAVTATAPLADTVKDPLE